MPLRDNFYKPQEALQVVKIILKSPSPSPMEKLELFDGNSAALNHKEMKV